MAHGYTCKADTSDSMKGYVTEVLNNVVESFLSEHVHKKRIYHERELVW